MYNSHGYIAKIFYGDENLLYKHGMVDDILRISKFSSSTVSTNATINALMELNKLKLAQKKCGKIHIEKKCQECPDIFVHGEIMTEFYDGTYFGDIISNKGTLEATIKARKLKG